MKKFITEESRRLEQKYSRNKLSPRENILAETVKLNEEVGELCNEVLSFLGEQREEKLKSFDKEKLANEIADVLIVTLLIAKSVDVDFELALENKIKQIETRYN